MFSECRPASSSVDLLSGDVDAVALLTTLSKLQIGSGLVRISAGMVGILLNSWSSDPIHPSLTMTLRISNAACMLIPFPHVQAFVLVVGSLSQFTFYLFGVNELVANVVAGVKPGHESFRLSIGTFGKRHRRAVGISSAFGRDCLNRGIELGTVCVENLYDIPVRTIRCQDELVGPSRQDPSGHLNRLAKGELRHLIFVVRLSGQLENESKSDNETSDHV
jgi:hypothetical protein